MMRRRGMSGGDVINKILITMDMSTPSTAGFTFIFTGNLFVDFKEGGGAEALTSGVEKTHLYVAPGTYVAEITGDTDTITEFIGDNSKITLIENIVGDYTRFDIQDNLYDGVLDFSNATISSLFFLKNNTRFTDVIFASSGNSPTAFNIDNCGYEGVLDLSNVPLEVQFRADGNPLLTNVTFASSGNLAVATFSHIGPGLSGTYDVSDLQLGSTSIAIRSHPLLTNIITSNAGNSLKNVAMYTNALTYTDFTGFVFNMDNGVLNYNINDSLAADINQMLVELYALVSSEGAGGDYTGRTIFMGGAGMAAPDGSSGGYDGLTAKTNLQGKGITVNTN